MKNKSLKNIDEEIRSGNIEYALVTDTELHVLGIKTYEGEKKDRMIFFYLVHNAETGELISEDTFEKVGKPVCWADKDEDNQFRERRKMLKELYETRLEKFMGHIKIYQGPIEEAERDLEKELELVSLEGPETFLRADECRNNNRELRILAYNVGADAIIHYRNSSACADYPVTGTPVRCVKSNNQ